MATARVRQWGENQRDFSSRMYVSGTDCTCSSFSVAGRTFGVFSLVAALDRAARDAGQEPVVLAATRGAVGRRLPGRANATAGEELDRG
ncbi:hypothetical protein [Phytohabitans rumicis]|uniref:hypothetical protein n=1 Tax=Phytohabitans rumicis TaxID=1076125 RepID=UPI0031F00DA3